MGSFEKLGLKKEIIEVLSRLNFKNTFAVQDKIIPLAKTGKNIVFRSRTGSGKTLAYSLGFIGKINKKQGIQMLIVVPTRELCIQVGKDLKKICEPLGINVGMLYGGRDIRGDYRTTRKNNQIIVGTPGRLIQHINDKNVKVGNTKCTVYDESDEMFDNGFYSDCAYIRKRVSKDSQVILSSATMTDKVNRFINKEIMEYELLEIGNLVPENITQKKIFCKINEKDRILLNFFSKKRFRRVMVFCNTKIKTYRIFKMLNEKFKAGVLNSDFKIEERADTLNLFKEGKIRILITTDVAARGLQIENVDIIVNYDVPRREEYYIHRIGRTGRKDKKGYALTLVCPEDDDRFYNIEFEYKLSAEELVLK